MKKISSTGAFLLMLLLAVSQNPAIDSLKASLKLHTSKSDTNRIISLWRLAQEYRDIKPDSALLLAQQALQLSRKFKYTEGESRALNQVANAYTAVGNYPKALTYYITKLKLEENRNDPENMAITHINIASVYYFQGEYRKGLVYTHYADSIADAANVERVKVYILLNLGEMYEKLGLMDSAMYFTQKAYVMALQKNDVNMIGAALNNLGNIHAKVENPETAIRNYKDAMPYLEESHDADFICESSLGLARQYKNTGQDDSAVYFAERSYDIAKTAGFLSRQLDASILLTAIYKAKKNTEQAFFYQEQVIALKDSIYSRDRIAQSQIISIEEELRQKDLAEKRLQEKEERRTKLQFLAIGIMLPILLFLSIYLSRKKVRPRVVEFFGVVSLLLMFEYLMLFLHPYVVDFTNHTPVFELMIFAAIAAVLTPTHHKIEEWLLEKLTHKKSLSKQERP